jgi:preprotein translocase subunit YajC
MIDPLTIMMLAVLALMVVFMIRNSRKQKADREALVAKVVKGANVMTTSGIFGTIVSLDEAENEIVLETTPGTKLRLHRQSVVSVIEKPVAEKASSASTAKSTTAKSASSKPAAK